MSDSLPATVPTDRLHAWAALRACAAVERRRTIADLFAAEPDRATRLSVRAGGLLLDLAKSRLSSAAIAGLVALAREADLDGWRAAMFAGAQVNTTERRAALHVGLRGPTGDVRRDAEVAAERARVLELADAVRGGRCRGADGGAITDVVNIGIGGSDLGPRLVCRALEATDPWARRVHFVASLDGTELAQRLAALTPARTLFVVTSKTFTTLETLANARSARAWMTAALGQAACAEHFVAVTASPERAREFGISADRILRMWDWVGGRYSLWSAVGLPIAVAIGRRGFEALLAGARAMDEHFASADPSANLPLLLAFDGIWNQLLLGAQSRAVLPYDHALRDLPAYLQQLEMESNGKHVSRDGETLAYPTSPVVWGAPGNNGQHAFYQLLHQGTQPVPCEFLVALEAQRSLPGHQRALVASALAQAEALMRGRSLAEATAELAARGCDDEEAARLAPHLVLPGNRPSTMLLYQRLDAQTLGSLLALCEHRVFAQSVCWGVNPFDQWGVEVGKQLTGVLDAELAGSTGAGAHDPSTANLLAEARARMSSEEKQRG